MFYHQEPAYSMFSNIKKLWGAVPICLCKRKFGFDRYCFVTKCPFQSINLYDNVDKVYLSIIVQMTNV